MSERYAEFGYTTPGHTCGAAGLSLAKKFVSVVKSLGGVKTICDLGCGNGSMASLFGAAGFYVTGVDASASGIEVAKRNYATPNVSFMRLDFETANPASHIEGAPFDAVVSSDVIEHLYRPSALIDLARDLLQPGGKLVVGTPYHGYLKNLAIALSGKWDSHHGPNWDGGHIKFFSERTLTELVSTRGFGDVRFHFHGRGPLVWKNMICVASKTVG